MTPDEEQARTIIDQWIHRTTGLSPVDRGLKHTVMARNRLAREVSKAAQDISAALSQGAAQ